MTDECMNDDCDNTVSSGAFSAKCAECTNNPLVKLANKLTN